jgi:hypothetical protein
MATIQVVRWGGPESPEDRLRVERAVAAGLARAWAAAREGAAPPAEAGWPDAPPAAWGPDWQQGTWVLPSYQQGGAPVQVPVLTAPHGDRVVQQPFSDLPLVRMSVNEYLHSGGSVYVETPSLARAIGWGRVLYGGLGFAVLERRGRQGSDRFVTVGFDQPVLAAKFGPGREVRSADPDAPSGLRATRRGMFFPLADFWVVTAVTVDDEYLYGLRWRTPWPPGAVWREYRRTPPAQLLAPADAARVAAALLTPGPGAGAEDVLRARIVDMDRTVFALMPWQQRAGHLATLAGLTWPSAREQKAMVELVASARSRTELEAIFAILRERGAYERLFAKLDGTVVELLVLLGEWQPPSPIGADYLIALFSELHLVPKGPLGSRETLDLERHLRNRIDGLVFWVRSTVSGIKELFDHSPAELAEGVGHLVEFALVLDRATRLPPDLQALAIVLQLAAEAGKTIRKAMAGLEYAEQLGTPYGRRGGGARITADLAERLQTALAVEVLTWFVGIGELKEAIAAAEVPERLAALLRVFSGLRRLGKAAEVAEEASRLDRFLAVLVRLAELRDEVAAARALRLLPAEQLSEMARLAELLNVPKGASLKAFRAAAKGKGVMGEVSRIADALSLARRFERRAAAVGGVTEEMAAALRRLLDTGWGRKRLAGLVDAVPQQRLAEWSRALRLLRPEQVERLGAQGLQTLAYSPRSLRFIGEAGGDAYLSALSRFRGDTRAVEQVLQGLELSRAEIGNPAEFQRLLDRIAAGEAGAYTELAERVSKAAEAALERLRKGGRRQLLEELEEFEEAGRRLRRQRRPAEAARQLAARDRLAAQLGELGDKELDGLEQLARLAEDRGGFNWEVALDLPSSDRADLLTLVDDVAGRLPHGNLAGLEDVLRNLLERQVRKAGRVEFAVQGSWGQLYAARTLIEDFGATALEFEAVRPHRTVDVVANLPGRGRISVEVKTNLAEEASFVERQLLRDLTEHARSGYADLLYLYHPDVAGQLPELGQRMLQLFDQSELRRLLRARGLDPDNARRAFEGWLKAGNLRTYKQ